MQCGGGYTQGLCSAYDLVPRKNVFISCLCLYVVWLYPGCLMFAGTEISILQILTHLIFASSADVHIALVFKACQHFSVQVALCQKDLSICVPAMHWLAYNCLQF